MKEPNNTADLIVRLLVDIVVLCIFVFAVIFALIIHIPHIMAIVVLWSIAKAFIGG